jgi:glycosyltransferase involved in cell wall biosynthesis
VAGRLAARRDRPRVITLYGTDVWHHDAARHRRFAAVVRGAAHRVFYSRALLEFARPLGLADEPASVIYAPVAPGFRSVSAEERDGLRQQLGAGAGPMLVTVKRLHPVAGHEDLLRALPEVARGFPNVSLWLAGDGPLRLSLEALARELDVASRVRFLGALPNDALWRCLAAADCFVLPSRLESWGTVMLEALACGTPVVATDTAGGEEVRSYFPDDVELCEKENPGSLAAAVVSALRTSRRTSQATKELLEARFSPAACAATYRKVYDDALRVRSSQAPAT